MTRKLTVIIEREDDGYVALCPDVDVASQGDTVDEARNNLEEALELFFETASKEEINERFRTVAVPVPDHKQIKRGTPMSIIRQSGAPRSEFE